MDCLVYAFDSLSLYVSLEYITTLVVVWLYVHAGDTSMYTAILCQRIRIVQISKNLLPNIAGVTKEEQNQFDPPMWDRSVNTYQYTMFEWSAIHYNNRLLVDVSELFPQLNCFNDSKAEAVQNLVRNRSVASQLSFNYLNASFIVY